MEVVKAGLVQGHATAGVETLQFGILDLAAPRLDVKDLQATNEEIDVDPTLVHMINHELTMSEDGVQFLNHLIVIASALPERIPVAIGLGHHHHRDPIMCPMLGAAISPIALDPVLRDLIVSQINIAPIVVDLQ